MGTSPVPATIPPADGSGTELRERVARRVHLRIEGERLLVAANGLGRVSARGVRLPETVPGIRRLRRSLRSEPEDADRLGGSLLAHESVTERVQLGFGVEVRVTRVRLPG